jgi:dTMP kinase
MKNNEILKGFIVLEGLDGSGTTTQMKKLEKKFRENGIECITTMEPTDNPVGKLIRKVLEKHLSIEPETLAILFSADRNEHIYGKEGIKNLTDNRTWVICDRYLFSSIAYQSLKCDPEWVLSINNYPLPEYLFFLDVPEDVCSKRLNKRDTKELFDDLELQKRILENYHTGFKKGIDSGVKFITLDGTEQADPISEKIWNNLQF